MQKAPNLIVFCGADTYTSRQTSSGGSISVGSTGLTGGSINASASNINSNFEGVNQRSGHNAGDAGLQVSVTNNTALTGGVIATTDQAVNKNRNSFTTGSGLSTSDIQNQASFMAKAVGVSAGFGGGKPTGSAGVGSTSGSAASTSAAGISGIAGNTAVRTGDAEAGIKPIFDADKVQREVNAQVAITQAFGQQAVPAWGNYANDKFAAAVKARDEQAIKCWGPDGACRAGGHMLIGGLTGGVGGALGAGVSSVAAPHVQGFLIAQGIPLAAAQALTQLSAIGVGATVGGATGAAAFNESSGNAVLAIPWLVESIIVGGPLAARACLASPACQKALYLGGATVFAAVAAIATPPLASNNTGNTTPPPN